MKNVSQNGSRAMYTTMILLVICSLVFSAVVNANGTFYYIVMPIMACFFFGKFALAMMFCQGWKIFNRKMVLGLPVGLFIFYIIVIALLTSMAVVNQGMSDFPGAQKNLNVFIFNASIGVLGSLIAWFAGIKNWMAGGSEYDARMEFKNKGNSEQEIEGKIAELKNFGLIPS
jgi:hypothetical protein